MALHTGESFFGTHYHLFPYRTHKKTYTLAYFASKKVKTALKNGMGSFATEVSQHSSFQTCRAQMAESLKEVMEETRGGETRSLIDQISKLALDGTVLQDLNGALGDLFNCVERETQAVRKRH